MAIHHQQLHRDVDRLLSSVVIALKCKKVKTPVVYIHVNDRRHALTDSHIENNRNHKKPIYIY